jgi:hypothetical protein
MRMNETKRSRHRSPRNPAIPLEMALARAKSLSRAIGVRAVPVREAAEILGFCTSSSVARRELAAMKEFGLLEDSGRRDERKVSLTGVAVQLLDSSFGAQRAALLQKAALRPKIHGEIWQRFQQRLPDEEELRRYLVSQRSSGLFNQRYVGKFIEQFFATMHFSQLSAESLGADSALKEQGSPIFPAAPLDDAVRVRTLYIPLDHGGNAVLRLAGPVSDGDIERITESLKVWKSTLVPRQSAAPAQQDVPQTAHRQRKPPTRNIVIGRGLNQTE